VTRIRRAKAAFALAWVHAPIAIFAAEPRSASAAAIFAPLVGESACG
jgi:hypothetical protein